MRNPAEWSLVPDDMTFIPIQSTAPRSKEIWGKAMLMQAL